LRRGSPIPKGLRPPAQGWRARACLGSSSNKHSQPQRGCGHFASVRARVVRHNPVGVGIFCWRSPRVARASQPWASGRNPVGILGWRKRVGGVMKSNRIRPRSIPKGLCPPAQGWRARAYLGSSSNKHSQPQRGCGHFASVRARVVRHNPVGVGIVCWRFPRVARASQPWASGRNPVGILGWRKRVGGVMKSNRIRPRSIPTGLRPPAQGWRARAYLGWTWKNGINRNVVVANAARDGRNKRAQPRCG